MEPLADDKLRSEFMFLMFFAGMLPVDHVERIVDGRLTEIYAAIERMEDGSCEPAGDSHSFVHGYGLAIYRAMASYLEENRHLLEAPAPAPAAAPPGARTGLDMAQGGARK